MEKCNLNGFSVYRSCIKQDIYIVSVRVFSSGGRIHILNINGNVVKFFLMCLFSQLLISVNVIIYKLLHSAVIQI